MWLVLWGVWPCAIVYFIYDPSFILDPYSERNFNLYERVLTQFRMLIDYIRLIFIPDITDIGLYHDDIRISKSLINPIQTILSLILIIGLLVFAVKNKKRFRLVSLGILWFFGGHLLESTIISLELYFLHRNYIPSVGIIFVLAEIGINLYRNYKIPVNLALIAILVTYTVGTRFLNYQWSDDNRMIMIEAMNNPDSARANFMAGQILRYYASVATSEVEQDKYKEMAFEYFANLRKLDSRDMLGEMMILETQLTFQETLQDEFLHRLIDNLRTSKVDVPPYEDTRSHKRLCYTGDVSIRRELLSTIARCITDE